MIEQSNACLKMDAAFTNKMQVYKHLICIRGIQGLNNLHKNQEEGADQIDELADLMEGEDGQLVKEVFGKGTTKGKLGHQKANKPVGLLIYTYKYNIYGEVRCQCRHDWR